MPVAKHLSYTGLRSRSQPPRRIPGLSLAHTRALPQQASSSRRSSAATSVLSRSILQTARFVESACGIIWAITSWTLIQILTGCIAYAIAMYGIPEAALRGETGEPKPSAPPPPPGNPSRPLVHVILADTNGDIGADESVLPPNTARLCADARLTARSDQKSSVCLGWRTVIIAPAILLQSKIGEALARRRAIAELQNLDDRVLRDIGISRADIGSIRKFGAQPE